MFKPSEIRLLVLPAGMFLSFVLVVFFLMVNVPFLALLSLFPAFYGLVYAAPAIAYSAAWCYGRAKNNIHAGLVAASLRYRSRSIGLGVVLLFYLCVAATATLGLMDIPMLRYGRKLSDYDTPTWSVAAMLICGVVVMGGVAIMTIRDGKQLASLLMLRGVERAIVKKLMRIKMLWLIGPFVLVGCLGGVVVAVIFAQMSGLRPTDTITYHAPVIFVLYLVATLAITELQLGLKTTFSSAST